MMADSAIDAQRTASERTACVCTECGAPPGSPHAPDCVMRPKIRYEDYLQQRYGRGDRELFRIGGQYMALPEYLDVL